ncbi:MAG: MarR family transcriptional regulator [Spirochaetales bacterium]|nr:MarR family transcriptional regulator [Spirochaetales bacterium]
MKEEYPSPKSAIDLVSRVNEVSRLYLQNALTARGLDGLVPAHGQVFYPLFEQGEPLSLGEIVRISGRAKSTITGMAHTLEKHGYVKRIASPRDRRSVILSLTEKGWQVKDLFQEISKDLMDLVYRDMDGVDQEKLIELLVRVEKNLRSGCVKENGV